MGSLSGGMKTIQTVSSVTEPKTAERKKVKDGKYKSKSKNRKEKLPESHGPPLKVKKQEIIKVTEKDQYKILMKPKPVETKNSMRSEGLSAKPPTQPSARS